MTTLTCHPDRPHYAHGLCRSCYGVQYKRTWTNERKATCHPDRPHHAGGLCASCYVPTRPGWKEGLKVSARKRALETYGLTEADVARMLAEQGGKCAICSDDITGTAKLNRSERIRACVDHDHVTGAVRGLLCAPCNAGIGHFKDNPARLQGAIVYLTPKEIP